MNTSKHFLKNIYGRFFSVHENDKCMYSGKNGLFKRMNLLIVTHHSSFILLNNAVVKSLILKIKSQSYTLQ